MTPRVSIVVPTYNAPALLLETLATVFAQTFGDFELIVVNDGSTDDTAEQLATIADPRLRVITQANGGIGRARNRGIDEAVGEFVALLDHDDLWMPEKLAGQVRFMDAHPECVGCTVRWASSVKPERAYYEPTPEDGGIVRRPLRQLADGRVFLISSSMLMRRSALDGLRYFTRPRCIEDTPLQVKLLCRGPFGIAGDGILMIYRWHASNYSSQADFFLNGVRLLRELDTDGYFSDCPADWRADLDAFIGHLARTATLRQLQAGRRREAWRLYRQEFGHQLADHAYKYLLAVPVALGLPERWRPAGLGKG